jgi:hypothetical protein
LKAWPSISDLGSGSWQTFAVFGYAMVSYLAVNDAIKVAKSLVMSSSKRLAAADLSSRLVI